MTAVSGKLQIQALIGAVILQMLLNSYATLLSVAISSCGSVSEGSASTLAIENKAELAV